MPHQNTFQKALSEPNYKFPINKVNKGEEERGSNDVKQMRHHPPHLRSLSLPPQSNNGNGSGIGANAQYPYEAISLTSMARKLNGSSEVRKNSFSFSAVGHMVESMQKLHNQIANNKPDVERAVNNDDIDGLKKLCLEDDKALNVAALAAVKNDKVHVLEAVFDMQNDDGVKHLKEFRSSEGDSLLHIAAENHSVETAKFLLQR